MADRQLTAALAGAATAATAATAIKHSQPWRWVLHTASLDLYAEASATLSRDETLLTCGAALHRARAALAADSLRVRVDVFPDDDPQHVATLTPTGPAPHRPPQQPAAGVTGLVAAARAEGVRLRVLTPPEVDRLADATPLLARSATAPPSRGPDTVYAVLYGGRSTGRSWVRAGQALSAIEVRAAAAGLSVTASAAVVELGRSREILRRLLPSGVTPYVALRITPDRDREPAQI